MASRELSPQDVLFGGIWLGPGHGNTDFGQDAADTTVAAAVAAGITEFDTAPWYGAGAAEERLGRAVQKLAPGSAKVITKAGRLFRNPDGGPSISSFDAPENTVPYTDRICSNDYTAAGARASLQESLARMGLSEVHCLRIHDPNDNSLNHKTARPLGDEVEIALAEDGMIKELRKMRDEGLIKEVSLGMNCNNMEHQGVPGEVVRLIQGAGPGVFDTAMLAGGWNLLCQDGLPCLLECQRFGIGAHIAGTFASGLLVGVDRFAYMSAPEEMKEKAQRWRELAERHGVSLPAVAVAFAALPVCVSRVVIGMATAAEVEQNLAVIEESRRVPPAIWAEAKAEGLLNAAVPVPAAP